MSDAGFGESRISVADGGLPGLLSGPVEAQPVPVPNTDATVAAWNKLGDQATAIGNNYLKQQATIKGAQDAAQTQVTKDATGNIQITGTPSPRFPLTDADSAYNQAAEAGVLARAQLAAREQIATIQQAHVGDPQGFLDDVDTMSGKLLDQLQGEYQAPVRNMINQESASALDEINKQNFTATAANAKSSMLDLWQGNFNKADGLVGSGVAPNDPRVQNLLASNAAIEQTAKGNPAISMSPEELAKFDSASGMLAERYATWNAGQIYEQQGSQAAEAYIQKTAWDPSFNVPDSTRESFERQAIYDIRMRRSFDMQADAQQQQYVDANTQNAIKAAQDQGPDARNAILNDQQIATAYKNNPARGQQIIDEMHGAEAQWSFGQETKLTGPDQDRAKLAAMDPANNGSASQPFVPAPGSRAGQNLANNNPGNIKNVGGQGFQSFPTMQAGIDAVGSQLDRDINVHGLKTISDIISNPTWGYAPASDHNNTAAYIADVASRSKIPANQPLTAADIPAVRDAMITHEQGGVTPDQLLAGNYSRTPGWAVVHRDFVAAQTALNRKYQAISADPQGYVVANRPDIANLLASGDPQQMQQGIQLSLLQQQQLGVRSPQPLSTNDAATLVSKFASPPDPTHASDYLNGTIAALQSTYGSYFPQVMKQLQASGLPPEANALTLAKGSPAAYRMSQAVNSIMQMGSTKGSTDVASGRSAFFANAPDNSNIGKAIPGLMQPYVSSWRGSPQGPQQIAAMQQAMGIYSRQYAYEGKNATDAAQGAYTDLIGSKYNFVDGYRVPVGVDDSLVRAGANAIRGSLEAGQVEPYGAPSPGVTLQQRQQYSAATLATKGTWSTSADDKGLYLTRGPEAGYRPVLTADGKPVAFSWAQLATAGKNSAEGNRTDQQFAEHVLK